MSSSGDILLAARARRHGAKYSLRIIMEARRNRIPVSMAFALIEQESGFRNVFGSDPTIFKGAGTVTKSKYLAYKKRRGTKWMQGVGPAQLTWWEFQDRADRKGGCWVPRYNISTAFEILSQLIRTYGAREGLRRYNGSGSAAIRYADSVLVRRQKWHSRLYKSK